MRSTQPAINILYVNEIGPGKSSILNLLKNIHGVKEVIDADYRFRVGEHRENQQFLATLYSQWNREDLASKEEICRFTDLSLEELVDHYLNRADCIFISGSRFDPSSQYCSETPTRPSPDIRREAFEIRLMQKAKSQGIPLLAVCAGSWRLTSAYGGKTFAVPDEHVKYHEEWGGAERNPDRTALLKSKTMLHGLHSAAQRNKTLIFSGGVAQKHLANSSNPNQEYATNSIAVNSTHWRVSPPPESQPGTDFNRHFETTALDAVHKTVEAYESKFGAPTIAVQWHPELVLPEVRNKDGSRSIVPAYKTHRMLLEGLVESGLSYKRKKTVLRDLKFRGAYEKPHLAKL
jgi:gamma-glutamyl-gamma-aminobutyrate hydrolase PuuD